MSRLDLDRGRSLSDVRVHAPAPGPWLEAVRALPPVEEAEELEATADGIHLRVVHRTSPFVAIFRELRLMRRFPFVIDAGVASWVVVAPERKIRELLAQLQKAAPSATLASIRRAVPGGGDGVLTARQADLLRRAMAAGYFEVPRRISLTELAARLDLSASSLSETLAVAEKKLLENWPRIA